VTLADELEFIRGYVDIEQMRLGERLRDLGCAARIVGRVPSLILQPLVEHVQHGIAPAARREYHLARLSRGHIPALEYATRPWSGTRVAGPAKGIGLANTRARMRTCTEMVRAGARRWRWSGGDRADTLLGAMTLATLMLTTNRWRGSTYNGC
jgi:hypothetical protein